MGRSISARLAAAKPARRLFVEVRSDQLTERINGFLLIRAIGNKIDGGTLGDTQRQYAQKAFRVYSALFLFDNDRALELIGLLNKKGRRARI